MSNAFDRGRGTKDCGDGGRRGICSFASFAVSSSFFVVHSFFHFGGVVVVILGIINHVVKSRTCMMDLYWTYVGSMLEKYSDDIGHALG